MPDTDPSTNEWIEILGDYRRNHAHESCDECDPQRVAENHLNACYEAMDEWDESDPEGNQLDPSFGPFCGCITCVVREVLISAMPALVHHLTHKPSPTREALQREWDRS